MEVTDQKQLHLMPKMYGEVNIKKGIQASDYENLEIQWGDLNNYEIIQKIGRGKYSEVFEGINVKTGQKVVIKVLKPIRKNKIKREIKILQLLKNGPNIVQLLDVVKDPASKTTSLIFEYVNNYDYRKLYPTLTDSEARYYMYEILKAIEYCHSQGIMHRDIKPHNIMIDHEKKVVRLIDWGLAEFFFPGKDYNVRVSSRYYKGPELLVDYQYYDYSLDIWGLGCLFAGLLFNKDPFFQGNDNLDQLDKIIKVTGTEDLNQYLQKYNVKLSKQFDGILGKYQKRSFQKYVVNENQHLANPEAIDLLSQMLILDHSQRITAKEAMQHPYFAKIREQEKTNANIQNKK